MPDILLNHFYKIDALELDETNISSRITFDADHPIFVGHFPHMPVVPGVCQTQILGEVLSRAYKAEFTLVSASSIKFLAVIDPTVQATIDLVISAIKTDNGYTVAAQYKWDEKVFFKFKGVYKA